MTDKRVTRDEMFAVVKSNIQEIVEGTQGIDIKESDSMRDYGADSLEIVEVVSRSMKDLKIKVPRTELSGAKNLKDLLDLFGREVHLRLAVAFLIAAGDEAVDCHGIGVGRGFGLFDEDAKNAPLPQAQRLPAVRGGGRRFIRIRGHGESSALVRIPLLRAIYAGRRYSATGSRVTTSGSSADRSNHDGL